MDVDGFDGELARNVLELVVRRGKRAVFQVNTVLTRMDSALCVARRLRRVRNRGIGNRTREQSRRVFRLTVREV